MTALEQLVEELAGRVAERALELVEARVVAAVVPVPSPFVSVAEAAELLRCRRQRIHNLLSAGRLSRLKEGGRTLVVRAEVEALVVVERAARVAPVLPSGASGVTGSGVEL